MGSGDFAGNPCLTSVAPNRCAQWGQPTALQARPIGRQAAGARAPKGAQGALAPGGRGAARPTRRSALGAGRRPWGTCSPPFGGLVFSPEFSGSCPGPVLCFAFCPGFWIQQRTGQTFQVLWGCGLSGREWLPKRGAGRSLAVRSPAQQGCVLAL